MEIQLSSVSDLKKNNFDALVLVSFEGKPFKRIFNSTLTKIINNVINEEKFVSKFGEVITIYKPSIPKGFKFNKIIVVGGGSEDKFDVESLRRLGSIVSKNASKYNYSSCAFLIDWSIKIDKIRGFEGLIEGLLLGNYKFDKFISKKDKTGLELDSVIVVKPNVKADFDKIIKDVKIVIDSVFLARDLQNLPSNIATPTYISNFAKDECDKVGVKVKVIDRKEAEELGMNLFLAVAKGSNEEPKFVVMEYEGGGDKWYGIIGKGITFDTGGISLKPSDKMEDMKFDMSGAASVIATIIALAKLGLKVNVVGIVPLTENMPGGSATKPGDIVKGMGGVYVEIINTDAEGRLILADALEYVKRYKPEFVIDIATLTGACVVALGHEASGLLGNDDNLKSIIKKSSQRTFERVWELPLWDDYDEYIKSDFADVKNVGNRYGGAITASAFLKKFVDYKWAHIDIAGTAYSEKEKYYIPKGGTGFGVRLLVDVFKNLT
ncbi:MAG: leucyl aminopeptidase [Brevinematia bacterium]